MRGFAPTPLGMRQNPSNASSLKSPGTPSSISKGYREAYDTTADSTRPGTPDTTFPPTPHNPNHDPNNLLSIIPPGYGRAELLPGRTIRLTVRPLRRLNPAAGQYAFLALPVLSRFTSHPFTIVSVRDGNPSTSHDLETGLRRPKQSANNYTSSQLLEFIIRARQGLTLDLWNHLQQTRTHDHRTGQYIPAILRVRVDGSYGSAVRVKWATYGSVLVVVGGSGVAFGLSVLDRLCKAVRDADGRFRRDNLRAGGDDDDLTDAKNRSVLKLGLMGGRSKDEKVLTTRIRFVWLVREYCKSNTCSAQVVIDHSCCFDFRYAAHLMWCASNLRRLVQMVPPNVLQIDIFVTNFAPTMPRTPRLNDDALQRIQTGESLVPPMPIFAESSKPRNQRSKSRASSVDGSEDSDSAWSSDDSIVDLSYAGKQRRPRRGAGEEGRLRNVDDGATYHGLYTDIDNDEDDLGDGRNMFAALTNFDGEEDEREPAESSFSARVKKQGQHMRRKTLVQVEAVQRRHITMAPVPSHPSRPQALPQKPLQGRDGAGVSHPSSHAPIPEDTDIGDVSVTADIVFEQPGSPGQRDSYIDQATPGASSSRPPSRPTSPPVSLRLVDPHTQALRHDARLPLHSPLSPQYQEQHIPHSHDYPPSAFRNSANSPSRTEQFHRGHSRRLSARKSIAESLYSQYDRSPTADSVFDHHRSDTQSLRELLSASEAHLPTTGRDGGDGALDYLYNLSAREREDMGFIAALARPGRPRLDKILSSEVERSTGAIAVACCGPASLDRVVRKLVSSQIDPSRVLKGDQRGYITFYNEEFSF